MVRRSIAEARVKNMMDVKFFEKKGYSAQNVSSWKIQFEKRGPNSFAPNARPLALDTIALEHGQQNVLVAFTHAEAGKIPEGMDKTSVVKMINQLYRET